MDVVWEVAYLPRVGTTIWEGDINLAQMTVYGRVAADPYTTDEKQDARAHIMALAPQAIGLLRKLEWSGEYNDRDTSYPSCPICGTPQYHELHLQSCKLGNLLKQAREQEAKLGA